MNLRNKFDFELWHELFIVTKASLIEFFIVGILWYVIFKIIILVDPSNLHEISNINFKDILIMIVLVYIAVFVVVIITKLILIKNLAFVLAIINIATAAEGIIIGVKHLAVFYCLYHIIIEKDDRICYLLMAVLTMVLINLLSFFCKETIEQYKLLKHDLPK